MAPISAYDPSLRKNALASPPKLVSFEEIETILDKILSTSEGVAALLQSQLDAFIMSSQSPDNCSNLPIQTAGQPPAPKLSAGPGAQVCIKTGYVVGDSVLISKYAAGGGNFSGNTGSVNVYDQQTLRLEAILCDEGLLTEVRTAAAATLATKAAVAGRKIQKIGIIGGGVQALWHLRLLAASGTVDPESVIVIIKTRSLQSAQTFIEKMKSSAFEPDQKWTMEPYDNDKTGERFLQCQVIHTVTPSREPVLNINDVKIPLSGEHDDFLHISAIGSDSPGKCELSVELLSAISLGLVDSIQQCKERGEFQPDRWEKNLNLKPPNVVEIGANNVIDMETGMLKSPQSFTIFDSSGMAIQDVQIAKLISKNL